jgi:hypothetical protein
MLPKTPTFGQRSALRQSAPAPRAPVATAPVEPVQSAEAPAPVTDSPTAPAMAMTSQPSMPSQDVQAGSEARWARRTPTRLGAQILHSSLSAAILCTIRDTSSTGARLEVAAQRGGNISRDRVPEQFTLFMPADRLEVDCEVMWRQGLLVGVRYTSPTRRTAKQQPIKRPEPPKKPHTSLVKLLINPL